MKFYNQENRLTNDNCAQISRELQNTSINDRQLYNFYFTNDCKCEILDDLLFDNNFVVRDGYGFTTGCTVDTDSELRLNGVQTNDKEKIQLCSRWHQGVPNLNLGGLIPNIDSRMKNGDDTSDIRSCNKIQEKSFDRFQPFVGCLANTIQNPKHIIESGWVRGGADTRHDVLENKSLEKCGFKKTKNGWIKA